jgi:hypothetical protein
MEHLYLSLVKRIFVVVILLIIVTSFLLIYTLWYAQLSQVSIGEFNLEINENYYSGLITIVVSLFALALPLAVNAITANQDKRFSNNEMGDSFYKNSEYIFMKRAVLQLIFVTVLSYVKNTNPLVDVIAFAMLLYVLFRFVKFMKIVEGYVANSPNILIQEEKQKIHRVLGR